MFHCLENMWMNRTQYFTRKMHCYRTYGAKLKTRTLPRCYYFQSNQNISSTWKRHCCSVILSRDMILYAGKESGHQTFDKRAGLLEKRIVYTVSRHFNYSGESRCFSHESGFTSSSSSVNIHNNSQLSQGDVLAPRHNTVAPQLIGEPASLDTLPRDLSQMKKEDLFATLKELSLDDLLTLVARSHRSMDGLCLALCMKNIHRKYTECEHQDKLCEQLKNDLSFQVLVASLCAKAPHYDPYILYDLVRFFHLFGYSSQEFPLRVVLQLIRFGLGDLTLDQLIHLASIVLLLPETRETLLLIEGIKCLLNGRRDKINSLTLGGKVLLLDIFAENLEAVFTEELLSSLLEDVDMFEGTHTVIVLSALDRISYRCLHKKELLFECVSLLDEHFDDLSNNEVIEVLESVEMFKQKIHGDYQDILLRVAQRFRHARDIEFDIKLDVLKKLGTESLLDAGFLQSLMLEVAEGLAVVGNITEEHLTTLLLCIVDTPSQYGILQGLDITIFTGWLRISRNLMSYTGLECLKHLMAKKDQDVPAWVLEEEQRIQNETSSSSTKLVKQRTMYIDGLSLLADEKDIVEYFRDQAKVTGVEMLSGAAFVEFEDLDEDSVRNLNGQMLLDSVVQIKSLDEVEALPEPHEHMFVTEADYKEKSSFDWPIVKRLTDSVVNLLREKAESMGYHVTTDHVTTDHVTTDSHEMQPNSRKRKCAGLLLSQDSNPDNKVAVVIIKPGQYFHNTGDLKNSYRELVEEIQNNGNKVLVIYLNEVSSLTRDELCRWIEHRLSTVDGYQTPESWTCTNV